MRANKRLKVFRKSIESREQLVSKLFHDPFRPLDLKSNLLTFNEMEKTLNNNTSYFKRQNNMRNSTIERFAIKRNSSQKDTNALGLL